MLYDDDFLTFLPRLFWFFVLPRSAFSLHALVKRCTFGVAFIFSFMGVSPLFRSIGIKRYGDSQID
jgi:hypothetical protein